jgi:uncharacterized NAD-dependent epimerase/dehydratase family protein
MDLRSQYDAPVSAIVLAEGAFGTPDGKTANGVVAHSELFDAQVVVDSTHAGSNANEVLSKPSMDGVPVVASLAEALDTAPDSEVLVVGVAPAGGALPDAWKADIREAMRAGCDVVSGLHYLLGAEPAWRDLAERCGVDIVDVRKPPDRSELGVAGNTETTREADVVLVMGTDCASGKRTTTVELYRQARREGIDAAWVATGQTGIMTGAQRGVVVDSVPADFTAGVVEQMVAELDDHDVVFVEGQAALTHRAYGGVTLSILGGAWPDAVVVADDPDRDSREHFESLPVVSVAREASLIEELSDARVVAVSTWGDPDTVEYDLDVPVANAYCDGGPAQLLEHVLAETGTRRDYR